MGIANYRSVTILLKNRLIPLIKKQLDLGMLLGSVQYQFPLCLVGLCWSHINHLSWLIRIKNNLILLGLLWCPHIN